MKKFIILLLVLLSGNLLNAQSENRPKHFLGFNAGITNATLSGSEIKLMTSDPGASQQSKIGRDVSIFYKYEPLSFLYFKTGVGIVTENNYTINSKFIYPIQAELAFLSVPLLLGVQPINIKNSHVCNLSLESGFSANYDQGSYDHSDQGIYPGTKVERKNSMTAFLIGCNIDVKVSNRIMVFGNYRHTKYLGNYYHREYTDYDYQTNKKVTYVYEYAVSSNHISVGILFALVKKSDKLTTVLNRC